jgi:hypothetical protein
MKKKNNKLWAGFAMIIVAAIMLHMSGLARVPSSISVEVLAYDAATNTTSKVSGATCYVNQAGSSDCGDPREDPENCQFKDESSSNGMCVFGSYFDSSENWPIGVVCPAKYKYKSIQTSHNPIPGLSTTKTVWCTEEPPWEDTSGDEGYDLPDDKVTPTAKEVCVMEIYEDESCNWFSHGDKKYYYWKTSANRKLCWTEPGYDFGDCLNNEEPAGEWCVSDAYYFTRKDCSRPGYIRVGSVCYNPNTIKDVLKCPDGFSENIWDGQKVCVEQSRDCSEGETQIVRDGISFCVIYLGCPEGTTPVDRNGVEACEVPYDLVQGECEPWQEEAVLDGKKVCIEPPKVIPSDPIYKVEFTDLTAAIVAAAVGFAVFSFTFMSGKQRKKLFKLKR